MPHVVLLFHARTNAIDEISRVLNYIGIETWQQEFTASLEDLDETLEGARAVLVLIDEMFDEESEYYIAQLKIQKVIEHSRKTDLPIIPIIEQDTKSPADLTGFTPITFKKRLSGSDLRLVVERVLPVWGKPQAVEVSVSTDDLLVEARLQIPRLTLMIDEPRTLKTIGLVLATITTLAGIALSIPRVLTRLSLGPQWLFVGPILFIGGGLLTLSLYTNRRRERRRTALAEFLKKELEGVLDDIEKSREARKMNQIRNRTQANGTTNTTT